MQKLFLSALALAAALAQAGPAAAQSPAQAVSEQVSYADLNLATTRDVATFDRRINAAITRLCWPGPGPAATEYVQRQQCGREARANVRPQRAFAIAAARRGDPHVQVALQTR